LWAQKLFEGRKYLQSGSSKVGRAEEEVGKVVDMKDYYQTNKGRLLGIGGILIIVGLVLYFARHQEFVLVLPIVGIVLFIAGVIYKPRKKKENVTSDAQ
jgi:VIT1/CCC1 family predicted Fe2+/Mn2+ transporter